MLKLVSRCVAVAAALAGLAMAPGAGAAPITYSVALTSGAGNPPAGTGSFTIDGSDYAGVSNEYFTPGDAAKTLLDISFDIDGKHFDLTDAIGGFAQVFFQNGNVAGIIYQGLDNGDILTSLNGGAMSQVYSDFNTGHVSLGNLSAAPFVPPPPNTVVPEPASLLLLGVGLAAAGARRLRRLPRTA